MLLGNSDARANRPLHATMHSFNVLRNAIFQTGRTALDEVQKMKCPSPERPNTRHTLSIYDLRMNISGNQYHRSSLFQRTSRLTLCTIQMPGTRTYPSSLGESWRQKSMPAVMVVRWPTHALSRARKQQGRRLRQERRVPLPRHHHRQVRRRRHGLHLRLQKNIISHSFIQVTATRTHCVHGAADTSATRQVRVRTCSCHY